MLENTYLERDKKKEKTLNQKTVGQAEMYKQDLRQFKQLFNNNNN